MMVKDKVNVDSDKNKQSSLNLESVVQTERSTTLHIS